MRLLALTLGLAAVGLIGVTAAPSTAQTVGDDNDRPRGFTLFPPEGDWRTVSDATSPYMTLAITARCLVDARPDEVRAYLAITPASSGEEAGFEAFQSRARRCMPDMDFSELGNMQSARGEMTMLFEHSAMRGALAEALLREEDAEYDPASLALGDEGMFVADRFHQEPAHDPLRRFSLGFAGCVMGNNSAELAELFATTPGSAEERTAVMGMADSFAGCVMEGQSLNLRAPSLRTQLAEVTYYATHMEGTE